MIYALTTALFAASCSSLTPPKSDFIQVKEGHFILDGKPYAYVGTNFWYGPILASQGEGGNRSRLLKELDFLQQNGICNLRILVGADGVEGVTSKITPTLQQAPSVYNDSLLDGLDYLLVQMAERKMHAVLYLNNSWEWSGGYSQYLEWAGCGKAPIPALDGWEPFYNYVKQYADNEPAHRLFANHVQFIVTRENRYTGRRYTDDPTIMAWQIGNEPRAFSEQGKSGYTNWLQATAAQIKQLDHNHLVSTGSEGKAGSEDDLDLYETIHADANIDYMTIHIWPYNWGWIQKDSIVEKLPQAIANTRAYIDEHLAVARRHNRPVVLEEFGMPRDGFRFDKATSTASRDNYFEAVFAYLAENRARGGLFSGCNFWAWGGFATVANDHTQWQKGDDYTGDPAQEEQGLNSVFASDTTTLRIINRYTELLKKP